MTARPALFLAAALALPAPASAFLFFGGRADAKAAGLLSGMSDAFGRGDCDAVLDLGASFFAEKPSSPLREEAYGYVGRCYEASGSVDKAIGLYKLALGLYPDNAMFAYRLALIYNQTGFPANAVPLFSAVLKVSPGDAGANLGLARAYAALGFLTRAGDYYSRAVILQDFRDAGALGEYARCMLKKRDWDEALFIAGKGEQAAPGLPDWPDVEAAVRAGEGDYYRAVQAMDEALRRSPSREFRLRRALYLLLGGLPHRAMDAADAELAAAPRDPLASVIKAMGLYSLGRAPEAAPYFEAAREGGPFTSALAAAFLKARAPKPEDACRK